MTRDDLPHFGAWISELAQYFPSTKVNLEVVVSGYFAALQALHVEMLPALMTAILTHCQYFPTVAEVIKLARTFVPSFSQACTFCPTGHGYHEGHAIAHYPDGPFCKLCNIDMPFPDRYNYAPPSQRQGGIPQHLLPQYSQTPLTAEEVKKLVEEVMETLNSAKVYRQKPSNEREASDES